MIRQRMRNYHIKAYNSDLQKWKRSAKKSKLGLSAWIRNILDLVSTCDIKPEFVEAQMVRGNDSERDEFAVSCQFRVTEWQVSEWNQCADFEGLTIGEWCRQCLNYVCDILEK